MTASVAKVFDINGGPSPVEPNKQLVKNLLDLLEMANSGELQSFIGTGFTSDGLRVTTWGDYHNDRHQMLGSLAWMQAEYIHRHTRPAE